MQLDGIHHITRDHRRRRAQRRLLHARPRPAADRQDRQPGRPDASTTSSTATSTRGPGADLTFFEYPGAIPGRPGAGHGAPHRLARRLAQRGARLLGRRASAPRASACRARRGRRAALRRPRGPRPRARRRRRRRRAARSPTTRRSRPSSRCRASRACAPTAATRRQRARARAADGRRARRRRGRFELRGERRGGWIAFDPAPAERGRQSAGIVHHVAWGTTDDDLRELDRARRRGRRSRTRASSTATTSTRSTSASRAACSTSSRRAEPGFTVDGPVEELGTQDHPAAVPRAAPRADRARPDAAARPARRLGDGRQLSVSRSCGRSTRWAPSRSRDLVRGRCRPGRARPGTCTRPTPGTSYRSTAPIRRRCR